MDQRLSHGCLQATNQSPPQKAKPGTFLATSLHTHYLKATYLKIIEASTNALLMVTIRAVTIIGQHGQAMMHRLKDK